MVKDLLCNEQIKKTYMIPDFKSHDEAVKMFERLKEMSYSNDHFEYGIYLEDKLIGFINDVEIKEDFIEVGYVITPEFRNREIYFTCIY